MESKIALSAFERIERSTRRSVGRCRKLCNVYTARSTVSSRADICERSIRVYVDSREIRESFEEESIDRSPLVAIRGQNVFCPARSTSSSNYFRKRNCITYESPFSSASVLHGIRGESKRNRKLENGITMHVMEMHLLSGDSTKFI